MADIRELLQPPGRTRSRARSGRKNWTRQSAYAPRQRWASAPWLLAVLVGATLGLWGAPLLEEPAPPTPVADPWRQAEAAEVRRRAEQAGYAATLQAQEDAPPAPPETRVAGVGASRWTAAVRVVDGDTFWAGNDKIRIADIDTPEARARCPVEAALAARATRRLEQLLAAGPFALEPTDRDEDRYGRKLRVVTRGGESLGGRLVAEGLARPYAGGPRAGWC